MNRIPTPKESNVYSNMICIPRYDSFGVEHGYDLLISYKHTIPSGLTAISTQKESNVYSNMICIPRYDSFGVEHGNDRHISYKHTIPSG